MLELQIIQDANLLDSLGQVGLDRTIRYCKNKNIPLYNNTYPLDYDRYAPKTKLLNRKTAKDMANPELDVLKKFIDKNVCKKI